ncbi:MAG: hypothetical protein RIC18_12040 [Hoeflea sp.]|uniref:hypothetical protein n=1 Tax=Hoeflea sp. TaxID=1940281 RepID=UPI0032EADF4B
MNLTDFKLSRAVPVAIATLITVNIAALGFAELQISKLAESSQELAEFTRQNDASIKELEVLTKGIELDIVSTQEALTDISATAAWMVWMTALSWRRNQRQHLPTNRAASRKLETGSGSRRCARQCAP